MDILPCIIGGRECRTPWSIPVIDPWTGGPAGYVSAAGPAEMESVLKTARIGAAMTAALPAYERSAILSRFASLIGDHAGEFARMITAEGGKPARYASAEVSRAISTIRIAAGEALSIAGEQIPCDLTAAGTGRIAIARRVPVGVVLAITPFNFPVNLVCHKLGPAVASGNALIIRPASKTPMTALLLGRLLLEAGFPPQALSVVPSTPDNAEILVRDRQIGMLSFTGSPAVGWYLRSITGARKVSLELGGNAAVIIDEGVDPAVIAEKIVEGGFSHAGQVCISVQRVFVHTSLYQTMVDEIVAATGRVAFGDPTDPDVRSGPLVSDAAADRVMAWIGEAVSGGAVIVAGGTRSGRVIAPTVLLNTTPTMQVNADEVFGPVITVTAVDSCDEAIRLVNDSRFGLQAGIFTRDLKRAFHAAETITAGAVIINDIPTFRMDHLPYGGVKESGTGREGPRYAIEEMTDIRLVIITP